MRKTENKIYFQGKQDKEEEEKIKKYILFFRREPLSGTLSSASCGSFVAHTVNFPMVERRRDFNYVFFFNFLSGPCFSL